jgi:hypothetical protein
MRIAASRTCFFVALLGMSIPAVSCKTLMDTKTLKTLYQTARNHGPNDTYRIPSRNDLETFSRLFQQTLLMLKNEDGNDLTHLQETANGLGFQIISLKEKAGFDTIVIMEAGHERHGAGFYVITRGIFHPRSCVIQTPHAQSDNYTGMIGLNLFASTEAAAFFSSTMRRNTRTVLIGPEIDKNPSSADPAHNTDSFFHVAAKTLARTQPDMMAVQLHGFETENDDTNRNYQVIASPATSDPERQTIFRKNLKILREKLIGFSIGEYGTDTHELGALTNIQGKYINRSTPGCFLHLEMDIKLRKKLVQFQKDFQLFSSAINQVIVNYGKN